MMGGADYVREGKASGYKSARFQESASVLSDQIESIIHASNLGLSFVCEIVSGRGSLEERPCRYRIRTREIGDGGVLRIRFGMQAGNRMKLKRWFPKLSDWRDANRGRLARFSA